MYLKFLARGKGITSVKFSLEASSYENCKCVNFNSRAYNQTLDRVDRNILAPGFRGMMTITGKESLLV